MYLVHQIIVCILYVTLFCIFVCNRRHRDESGINIDTLYRAKVLTFDLTPALHHNDVITMFCFDKGGKDGLVYRRWFKRKRSILKRGLQVHMTSVVTLN